MATNGEPSTKKRKLEKLPNMAPIYEPPKKYSVLGLYDPEMVEVKASLEVEDSPHPCSTIFRIPKAIICARSEYFDKLFNGDFKEARERAVYLRDVWPITFRCFLGWLYCQRIFIERIAYTFDEGEGEQTVHIENEVNRLFSQNGAGALAVTTKAANGWEGQDPPSPGFCRDMQRSPTGQTTEYSPPLDVT